MLLNSLPTLVILVVQLLARALSPTRHRHAQRRLEHERHRAVGDAFRPQLRTGRPLVALTIRTVRRHHRVQRRTARIEPRLFGLVASVDQSHKLGHAVAMVVRRPESVLLHRPARRKDHEIGDGRAGSMAGARQHREDARIAVIEADRVDGHETRQIVLVRYVVAVPRDHVER